jgi:hypothetical protein
LEHRKPTDNFYSGCSCTTKTYFVNTENTKNIKTEQLAAEGNNGRKEGSEGGAEKLVPEIRFEKQANFGRFIRFQQVMP